MPTFEKVRYNQERRIEEAAKGGAQADQAAGQENERPLQQGEIRFKDKIKYDEEEGDVVPEIYREHRHQYSVQPECIDAFRRQIYYRSTHIGTKELEIVLGDYLKLHMNDMTYEELEEFDREIITIENPQMQRYMINGDPILPEHDTKWMKILMKYIEARKTDYYNNIPKDDDIL